MTKLFVIKEPHHITQQLLTLLELPASHPISYLILQGFSKSEAISLDGLNGLKSAFVRGVNRPFLIETTDCAKPTELYRLAESMWEPGHFVTVTGKELPQLLQANIFSTPASHSYNNKLLIVYIKITHAFIQLVINKYNLNIAEFGDHCNAVTGAVAIQDSRAIAEAAKHIAIQFSRVNWEPVDPLRFFQ